MSNFDEGAIKFEINWVEGFFPRSENLSELIAVRNELHGLKLIGVYENGIGYGNISCRNNDSQFIISGTQTGHIQIADESHFCLVDSCDVLKNRVNCVGKVKASSESLTHFSFYTSKRSIGSVIHIHHFKMWNQLKFEMPTTDPEIKYGTPEMAFEVNRLLAENTNSNLIVTAGHEEGLFVFGNSVTHAFGELRKIFINM